MILQTGYWILNTGHCVCVQYFRYIFLIRQIHRYKYINKYMFILFYMPIYPILLSPDYAYGDRKPSIHQHQHQHQHQHHARDTTYFILYTFYTCYSLVIDNTSQITSVCLYSRCFLHLHFIFCVCFCLSPFPFPFNVIKSLLTTTSYQ